MTSVLRQTSAFMAHQKPVVGDMKMSFVGYDHLGWMMCNGASLPVADNQLLFKVIGYQFGGGGNFFNLPNPAGRVAGVVGRNSEAITHPPGQAVGFETHTLLYTEMPAHNHDTAGRTTNLPYTVAPGNTSTNGLHNHAITDLGHQHTGTVNQQVDQIESESVSNLTGGAQVSGSNPYNPTFTTDLSATGITINNDGLHNHTIASNGMDQPHNNMQPTLFMGNMFIYSGVPTLGYWPYTIGMDAPEFMTPALNPPLI